MPSKKLKPKQEEAPPAIAAVATVVTVAEEPLPPFPPVPVPPVDEARGERITLVLPPETTKLLDWYAKQLNCTRAAVVHIALIQRISDDPFLVQKDRVLEIMSKHEDKA